MRDSVIIIPARLNSGRIKNKALVEIDGCPLIRHVYLRCLETGLRTYVATNSEEIADVVEDVIFTGEAKNGSERVAEAAMFLGLTNGDWVINVQGDKLVEPEAVKWFSERLSYNHESYHTLYCMSEEGEGGVRVLVDCEGNALYFTRKELPGSRLHCGIYGYTGAFLQRYVNFPSTWEHSESLEQMRALENGCCVKCFHYSGKSGLSINTYEDLSPYGPVRSYQTA